MLFRLVVKLETPSAGTITLPSAFKTIMVLRENLLLP